MTETHGDILDDLRKVRRLRGDTYSSAEVLGMVGRAIAEIEQLRATVRCERASGKCVMVHDPERDPCTRRNCHFMGVVDEKTRSLP
jgi:hypothetical protein